MHFSDGSICTCLHILLSMTFMTTQTATALQDRLHWKAKAKPMIPCNWNSTTT